jgi:multiple sugar transport system permease protein
MAVTEHAPPVARRSITSARRRGRRRNLTAYTYLLPYLALLLVFGLGPAVYAIFLSFTNTMKSGIDFNGVDNYIRAVSDFRFWPSFENVAIFLAVWLPIMIFGVLLLALLLQARPGRITGLLRLIYYLPGAVTGAAAVVLWLFVLDPTVSPFGIIERAFGWQTFSSAADGWHLSLSIALLSFSMGAGGWIVIVYGAFQNVSQEVLEAAAIDGANAWRQAFHIKLPLIQKYIVYMIILSFAGGTQLFAEPQILGKAAGPGTVSPTWSPNLLSYDFAFNIGNFGVASAISVILLVISLVAALILVFKTHFFEIS